MAAVQVATKLNRKAMWTYVCRPCSYKFNKDIYHLTSSKKGKNSSKGNPETVKRNKWRHNYRRYRLPIEMWESEGGFVNVQED